MLEAVWSVEFLSRAGGSGNGIAVFEAGRICGGNDTLIYTGRYRVEAGVIHADVKVQTYALDPVKAGSGGAGFTTFELKVTGTPDHDNLFLTGHLAAEPGRTMTIRAIRRAELP